MKLNTCKKKEVDDDVGSVFEQRIRSSISMISCSTTSAASRLFRLLFNRLYASLGFLRLRLKEDTV